MKSRNTTRTSAKVDKKRRVASTTRPTTMTLAEAETLAVHGKTRTDWAVVDALTDAEIADAVARDPDAPALLDAAFWRNADLLVRAAEAPKATITIRVDSDMLADLKRLGPGYQSRINAVLRAYTAGLRRKAS